MPYKNRYYSYRHDLSGSRTKNRYRYELYWGINKIYELYLNKFDFFVVFDYASDIDVIVDGKFEFYQLKTRKSNITLNFLMSLSATNNSIISKLAELDNSNFVKKLAVVSNAKFNCSNKKIQNQEEIIFNTLEESEKESIQNHLKQINKNTYDLKKYSYINSDMPLNQTDNNLLGSTSVFLQKALGTKMIDPIYFKNYLQNKVINKATSETFPNSFDNAITERGVSKDEISNMLESYKEAYHPEIEEIYKLIEEYSIGKPIMTKVRLKRAYNNLQATNIDSGLIKNNVQLILREIESKQDYNKLDLVSLTETLINNIKFEKVLEHEDKLCLIFMAYNRLGGSEII